jgi:hypothetical protein
VTTAVESFYAALQRALRYALGSLPVRLGRERLLALVITVALARADEEHMVRAARGHGLWTH